MKEQYIARISERINDCNDVALLNLILQLLVKNNRRCPA